MTERQKGQTNERTKGRRSEGNKEPSNEPPHDRNTYRHKERQNEDGTGH